MRINLDGQSFGRLTVISIHHVKKSVFWTCACTCGNQKVATTSQLRGGSIKSCGCLSEEAENRPIGPRFWSKVQRGNGCWLWMAKRERRGYGRLEHKGKSLIASRVAWELTNGPIPQGLLVLHRCDNPPCVNPDHLFLGTTQDNVTDKMTKGRHYGNHKLIADQVREIREAYATGSTTLMKLSHQYGVSFSQIHRIVTGESWPMQ